MNAVHLTGTIMSSPVLAGELNQLKVSFKLRYNEAVKIDVTVKNEGVAALRESVPGDDVYVRGSLIFENGSFAILADHCKVYPASEGYASRIGHRQRRQNEHDFQRREIRR